MRHLHKSWQDRRPGWTQRVRWYEPGFDGEQWRLEFITPAVRQHRFYGTREAAQAAYDSFIGTGAIPEEARA